MKNFISTLFLLYSFSVFSIGQIEFKLERLQDDSGWGVYAKFNNPDNPPPVELLMMSGQVTIINSSGFELTDFTSVNGVWNNNVLVSSPAENPSVDYSSVKYLDFFPIEQFQNGKELLLFTFDFRQGCPSELHLINNNTDPFNNLPNSEFTNPGNDFVILEKGYLPETYFYNWSENYQDCPDVCSWCDQSLSSTDEKIQVEVNVYPNPSNGNFAIEIGGVNNGNMEIQIINQLGQVVHNQSITKTSEEINSNLENGIYSILIIKENHKTSTQRLIISK